MINIACPIRDCDNDIECIINEKKGKKRIVLNNLLNTVRQRYSDYSKIELSQRIVSNVFKEVEKDALRNLYGSLTSTSREIINAVLKVQLSAQAGCCISCGIGEADQIDHFLPQEHFPEFSILHKNLLPICGTCNMIKSDHIPGSIKDFFHPMYDKLPDECFLDCVIEYKNHIPIAQISINGKFSNSLIDQHFRNMNLKKRIEEKATQYFLQIRAYKVELGDNFAQEEIERDLMKTNVCFGPFFWKYLLCKEMLNTRFVENI